MRTFIAENAMQWATAISYPRLVGTAAEPEARRHLRGVAEGIGLPVVESPFHFFPAFSLGILKNILLIGGALLVIHRLLFSEWPRLGALLGLALPFIAMRLWGLYRRVASQKLEERSGKHPWHAALIPSATTLLRSGNLVADLPVRGEIRHRLVFSAHTDSKSQTISIVTRAVASIVFAIGVLVLPFLTAPALIGAWWLQGALGAIWWILWALAELSAVLLWTMKVTNVSSGALDDAGACGTVLEVARSLAEDPPEGVAVRVLLTGAEELGLAGAYYYAKTLDNDSEWKKALHLNFEGAGDGTRLWLATGVGPSKTAGGAMEAAVSLAERAARDVGLEPKRLSRLVGGEADHIHLIEAGLSAVTLMFSGGHGMKIHTAGDRSELFNAGAFEAAGRTALRAVQLLEEQKGAT